MDETDKCLMNCEMFGKHAGFFESQIVPLWGDVYDSLVSRARISGGEVVLDAGTGTGEVALRVSPLVGSGGRVVAIDLQDEMMDIGRRKAAQRGIKNVDFRQASLEDTNLPDSQFDAVVANYALCCCFDYEKGLAECLRVLKPAGRLIYNHGGPSDAPESTAAYDLFERYKPRNPSKRLRALRASDEAQMKGVERYRNPRNAVAALRRLGYQDVKSTLVPRKVRYQNAAAYVDRMLGFDLLVETDEMEPARIAAFREEAIEKLSKMNRGPGFVLQDETAYFTATKAK